MTQKYFAEAIGTFALVFIGAGAVVANSVFPGSVGLLGIALAHGLVLMSMIYALGNVSGGHFNPAVSLAVFAAKKMDAKTTLYYLASQLIGASIAGFLLLFIYPSAPAHLGTPDLNAAVSATTGVVVEAVLTFFLVTAVFGAALDAKAQKGFHGLAIGLVLAFDILMGGMLTGAAMNPARAFGPAIASGFFDTQLVYWVGPIAGAVIAALVFENVFWKKKR